MEEEIKQRIALQNKELDHKIETDKEKLKQDKEVLDGVNVIRKLIEEE